MNAPASSPRPFIGREVELAELRGALAEATTGLGRLVLLVGEAGIGKTRLADRLAAEAVEGGVDVVWGRCWDGDGAPPYWPWVQVIRALLRNRGAEALAARLGGAAADVAALDGELAACLPGTPPATPLTGEQGRFRLFDSATALLRAAAATRPTVLVLDDLHWADPPSLLLLQFLSRELRDVPLLVIATYRDADVHARVEIAPLLGELATDHGRVQLRGLGADDVAVFIERITEVTPAPALVAAVHQATDGNPFFIDEVVHLLAAEGRLSGVTGGYATLPIPDGVRDAIRRRLAPLPSSTCALLGAAAVIGREFDPRLLHAAVAGNGEAAAGVGLDGVVAALGAACDAGVLARIGASGSRFGFVHALIRETLYDDLGAAERLRLHRQVGSALERQSGGTGEPSVTELAHHFTVAAPLGDAAKAVVCARRAAEEALRALAYEEAAYWYERALAVGELAGIGGRERGDLLLALGGAAWRAGDWERAETVLQTALQQARERDDGVQHGRSALALGAMRTERGLTTQPLLPVLGEAIAALGDADAALRVRLQARLATAYQYVDPARQRALGEEAVAGARRIEDAGALAAALQALHAALWEPDSTEVRLALADETVRLADASGDRELALDGRALRIFDLLERGDAAAADAEIDAYANDAEAIRQPRCRWAARIYRGMQALLRGRFAEAERLAESALVIRQAPSRDPSQFYGAQLFGIRREQDRLAEFEGAVERLVQHYPALLAWRAALAFLYCETGRFDPARRQLERLAANDFDDLPHDANWLPTIALLAEVAVALADRPRAARLYALLRPYSGRVIMIITGVTCRGAVDHYLGILATLLGEWDAGAAHFEAALALHTRMHAWPWLAHTQHAYATMLRTRGGDARRAADLTDQALQAAEALGMPRLGRLAREQITPPAAAPPAAGESRTQREAPVDGSTAIFRRENGYWTISFEGRVVRLKDTKGLHGLAVLLQHPAQEFAATDLVGMLGEPKAMRGKPTAAPDPEQARINVTKVIALAVRKIAAEHAVLGHYLSTTISTGRLCSYRPDPRAPIAWEF
jgi:tetratricopeptide (TPR) repeat protein